MTNIEILQKIRKSTFITEDDEDYQLEFQAGLTEDEIRSLKQKFPANRIEDELLEILKETRGWEGYGPSPVFFDSIAEFGHLELAPLSITLGHDGLGNFWILDINSEGSLGKVFFACHDPAVLIVHSQNLNEFLLHLLDFYEKPHKNYVNEVSEKTIMTIWSKAPNVSSKQAFASNNPEFLEYLSKFEGNNWTVADLRGGKNKDGFAWGQDGPNQLSERHPIELVWVMKDKENGFFSRLFGSK